MISRSLKAFAAVLLLAAISLPMSAQSLRTFDGSTANTLPANDDGYVGPVSLGFNANFFGNTYNQTWVNNNGNLTFNGGVGTYTPYGLSAPGLPAMIAPFFADVDTRSSSPVTYGAGILSGHNAFAANYANVGVFNMLPYYNTFQVVLIDRSEIAAGDFDIEFNYTMLNWEAGTYSGGNNQGLGGTSAVAGYTSGGSTYYQLPGSLVNGAFLDTNLTTGLIYNSFGTPFDQAAQNGRYTFNVRNGEVQPPVTPVPEPSTYGLMGATGLLGFAFLRRRFARKA